MSTKEELRELRRSPGIDREHLPYAGWRATFSVPTQSPEALGERGNLSTRAKISSSILPPVSCNRMRPRATILHEERACRGCL